MNLSASVMLVNENIRPVRVEYDPDIARNNNPNKFFKTLDTTLVKDDLVIVPTNTRHQFTIAKVVEIDFPVDFNSSDQWGWIGGKFDKATYDEVLETEKKIVARIGKTQENKMRAELREAAGLGNVSFTDLDLMGAPAIAGPKGSVAPAPDFPTATPPDHPPPAAATRTPPPMTPADYGAPLPKARKHDGDDEMPF